MNDYIAVLEPGCFYHIYNRANGCDKLFSNDDNYSYFLNQYKKYISPVADSFSFCLLPNHFHFLIGCKEESEVQRHFIEHNTNQATLSGFQTLTELDKQKVLSNHISRQFSHLFNGYTQAYNKQQNRTGSLFSRPFKRIAVKGEDYRRNLVHYIHFNCIEAGLCDNMLDWKYSSYRFIINRDNTFVKEGEILEWFNGMENFMHFHSQIS